MYFDLTEREVETPALYSTTRGIPPLNPERERQIHSRTLAPCIRLSLRQRHERPERALRKGTVAHRHCPGGAAGSTPPTSNRLRLPLPDCALPGRSAGRAQQRQRVDHSDDRNHREGQCQFPITPHAARGHQLRKAQVGNYVRCQECR